MQYRLVLFTIVCFAVINSFAQKTKAVTGTYMYYAPENISLEEAKHIAVNRAKIEAVSEAFGTLVTQNNATVISNSDGKSENRFLSIGGSEVKGEWIETTKQPEFDIKYIQSSLVIKVTLEGVVPELPKNYLTFSSYILRNGTSRKYENDNFKNGDDMYLSFSAPTNGYLIAYMYDETTDMAVCLLPYISDNSIGNVPIKGGQQYLFFKKATPNDAIDEYTLTANGEKPEFETLYLIFSTSPIYTISNDVRKSNEGMRIVPYKDFNEWLIEYKKKTDVTVKENTISIKP